jgi:hypothetical protein
MAIPYRTQRVLKKIGYTLLALLLVAVFSAICAFVWLGRYVVYTSDQGAVLRFDLDPVISAGVPATPPERPEDVSIYYNEGDNAISVTTELTQMLGYYVDSNALKDIATVKAQIQALPLDVPIMVEVKSIYGNFFYSSYIADRNASSIDAGAMDELIAYLKVSNRYAIAYLPAFRDYYYGLHHTNHGLAVKSGGYLWMDDARCYWLNPSSEGTFSFLTQIVSELRDLGFDEVVFSDFRFPDTKNIYFSGDKSQALADTAKKLVTSCATDSFAVSFMTGTATFPLPQGRSRMFMEGIAAANLSSVALESGLEDPEVNLVFMTEVHDTRFDVYSVLRPLSTAH